MSDNELWTQRYQSALMDNFGLPQRVFVKGAGTDLWDAEGKHYNDMFSGIAVGGLGHAHPDVIAAISEQLGQLGHISNIFTSPQQIELAERLDQIVVGGSETKARVYFANSGTEANEAAFKLTRLTGRTKIVAMEGSFHGRTMGSLAITHTAKYREPFEPLPGEVVFVPFGDVDALRVAVDDQTAAVVTEPIQGESGVILPPADFLATARDIVHQHGALLWVDEVQSGMGRCGEWLVSVADGVIPDLVTIAKGLGNGYPVAACVATGAAAELFKPGLHGSTYSGQPVAAAAGLAVLNVIERDGLLERVKQAGERLRTGLAGAHPLITAVRGRGLLIGVELAEPLAAETTKQMLDAGWIINAARPNILRLAPPLIVSDELIDQFVAALPVALDQVAKQ